MYIEAQIANRSIFFNFKSPLLNIWWYGVVFKNKCLLFQVDNLNLASNLENYFYAMLITCKCTPFCKNLHSDTKSEPPYLATTLWKIQSFHIRRIFNTHEKYGLILVDQTQNSDKTKRRFKLTRCRFSKTFPHDIHVECLLEVLEMIYHALLVLCKALKLP